MAPRAALDLGDDGRALTWRMLFNASDSSAPR